MKRTTATRTKSKQPDADAKLRAELDREAIEIAQDALREAVTDLTTAVYETKGGCEMPWQDLARIRDRVTQALVCVEMVLRSQEKADKVVSIGRAKGGAA